MMTYLVEDGGHLLAVEADGEQGLLVVVGGNVEHEEVLTAHRNTEDTGVSIEAAANVAMNAVEVEVLLATTIISFVPVVES